MKEQTKSAVDEILELAKRGYSVKINAELSFTIDEILEVFPARRFYRIKGTKLEGNYEKIGDVLNKYNMFPAGDA